MTSGLARRYRLNAVDLDLRILTAPAGERPMLKLMADTWRQMAARADERARLGEARSFAPQGAPEPIAPAPAAP